MHRKISVWLANHSFTSHRCYTLLDSDRVTLRPRGPVTDNIQAYHEARRDERATLMEAIRSDLPVSQMSVCSVGCGAAGEESLLEPRALALIEPDQRFAEYLREKYPRARIVSEPYELLRVPADLIYASGLGPWMTADPLKGIDADFLKFCRRNLAPNGVVIALIYGALHTGYVLDRRYYLERLLASTDLNVALYGKYRATNALLVLTDRPCELPALKAYLKQPLIENGVIRGSGERAPLTAPVVSVGMHVLRNIRKVLAEGAYLLRVNSKLRR